LELKRKLALGAVLCLSIFMILIAIIRYTLAQIPIEGGTTTIPDTIWLFFWQSIESCVAIIMVSLTAFRSLYGQERAKNQKGQGYDYVNESSGRDGRRRENRKSNFNLSSDIRSARSRSQSRYRGVADDGDQQELRVIEKRTDIQITEESTDQPTGIDRRPRPMPESFV
jgi:hypothetical protein